MNLPIKNIESFFSENLIAEAEALLQEGLVQGIASLEKNLWSMKVGESFEAMQNKKAFEVEIQLSGKKVKAFTCECDFFQQHKKTSKDQGCKHIVTGLFGLRRHLLQKERQKQKSKYYSPGKPKKLTTASVLNNVDGEALKNFVRAYARHDKKFGIALKAHFAHTVHLDDAKEKYLQLLQSTFASVRNAKDKLNYQATNQVSSVIKSILEHVDDAIALEHYSEAASILQALILKIAPNIKRAEKYEDKMLHLLELAFQGMEALLKKDLAPELKKEIWEFCWENFDSGEHKKYNTQHHFFKLLLELTVEKKSMDSLVEKIDEQLLLTFDKKKKGELLLIKMKLLEKFQSEQLKDFILENLSEAEVLLAAIQNAIQHENFKDGKQLALKGLAMQKSVLVKNQLDDLLLNIALKTQQRQDIVIYSRKRFLVTYDFNFYQILKNTIEKGWEKEVDSLLEKIKKEPYTPHKKETFATIYAAEKMNFELLNYIKIIRSLELLEKYDLQLVEEFKKEVCELYEDFLESYLRNHLGRKTSEKIRNIFYHLKQIGAKKLVYKLAKQYREQYPERHTLMEELAVF